MKIYVDNYKPIKLLNVLSKLEKYLVNTENRLDIYADCGIYKINNNNTYKIIDIQDIQPTIHNNFLNFTLILDKSTFSLEEETSLPNNHVSNHITIMKYSIQKIPRVYLVIEGNSIDKSLSHFIPNDFYFELDEEKYTFDFCKEDIIEFLSILN